MSKSGRGDGIGAHAGYSPRALRDKLGIKAGTRLLVLGAPAGYLAALAPLPPDVRVLETVEAPLDFAQLFVVERLILEQQFPALREALAPAGALWIAWPKQAARVPTDLTENVIREIGLRHGLVDVKVCAIDDRWSGLKFVYRLRDRG